MDADDQIKPAMVAALAGSIVVMAPVTVDVPAAGFGFYRLLGVLLSSRSLGML
jgi:hypothetical protein